MRGLSDSIRHLAADLGISVGDLFRDAGLGVLMCLVLFVDTALLLAGWRS